MKKVALPLLLALGSGLSMAQEVIVVERPTYVMTQRNHYARPYHPPVGINLQWGYPFEGGHRHWR